MANVANTAISATYGGANLNEIFYEPVFRSDDLMRNYRVIPNVKRTQNVYTAAPLTKIVNSYAGCSATSGTTQFDIGSKTITAGRCRVALEQCWDAFEDTFIEESYRNGVDVMNMDGTLVGDSIVRRAVEGIASDVLRLAWGGDITGAVAGYTAFDGWMELMKAESVIEFGAGDAASAAAPSAADALTLIRNVYDQAPAALQQVAAGDKKIFVTPKIFNAYLANTEGNSADLAIVNQIDGMTKVGFRGVELVPMYEWDTILTDTDPTLFIGADTEDYNQGVCYVAVQNLIIGSDVTDPEGSFKVFYDDLEEKMFFRGYFKLGVQYLFSSLVQWGIVTA
tara:strand:- start:299 stop:1312 length:1014 start_codon:yes stop_codon:yes gene_type:complete